MNKELKLWLIVVVVIIFLILSIVKLFYFSEDVEIMMRPEEIDAVEVNSIVDIVESESLGGDHLILYDTTEQFLDLVPEGETIYTYFELGEKEPRFPIAKGVHYQLRRKYLAFVNESRIIVYNDLYEYQEGNRRYWIEGWSWGSAGLGRVSFHYDNLGSITIVIFLIVGITFIIFIAFGFRNMPWYMP